MNRSPLVSKTARIAGFVVIGLAVVGLSVAAGILPRQTAPSVPVERITIANIGIFSNYNILAARKGYFLENGLDAHVDEYDSGATTMGALLAGKADIAIAANFVGVRQIFNNSDVRILASVNSHDIWQVLGRTDRGIAKPGDLKGKKVGVTLRTAGEFYLGNFLTENGLKMSDLQVVDLSATDIIAQIQDGRIDAAMIFDPNAYRVRQALGDLIIGWPAQGDRREQAVAYTTNAFIAAHPDVVARYVRALVEAERWQNAHEEEARQFLTAALGYDPAFMAHLWPRFTFALRLDQDLLVTMEDQARWNIENGLVGTARVPDYTGYIYFDALEKAKPSGVSIIH